MSEIHGDWTVKPEPIGDSANIGTAQGVLTIDTSGFRNSLKALSEQIDEVNRTHPDPLERIAIAVERIAKAMEQPPFTDVYLMTSLAGRIPPDAIAVQIANDQENGETIVLGPGELTRLRFKIIGTK